MHKLETFLDPKTSQIKNKRPYSCFGKQTKHSRRISADIPSKFYNSNNIEFCIKILF